MTWILDDADGSSFFDGSGLVPVEDTDYEGSRTNQNWFPKCPDLLAQRNISITKAWECPERRERQARRTAEARASKRTKHSEPGYRDRVSASMKAAYECPELRAAFSERKKQYWASWRAKNALAGASL